MEINARNRSIQSSIDCQIEEAGRDENLAVTIVSRKHIINFKEQISDMTRQINELREKVA